MFGSMTDAKDRAGACPVAEARVRIFVNGAPFEAGARTLSQLLAESGFAGMKVATAVNGEFVSAAARADTAIAPGDRVEIVSPRQGG